MKYDPNAEKLEVISSQSSESMHDADDLPMLDWATDGGPWAWFGAWDDAFDFLPEEDRPSAEYRWWFVFNRVPKSQEEVEQAVATEFSN